MSITEQQLEDAAIGWFGELGWRYVNGPDIAPDGDNPARTDYRHGVLRERLLAALARINPHIPTAALEQAAHELLTVNEPLLVARNRRMHRLLLSGIPVEFSEGQEKRTDLVNLIDFANPRNNDFLLVSERHQAAAPSRSGGFRQRPAAGGDRAEEPGQRADRHLGCLQPDPDLQGRDRRPL